MGYDLLENRMFSYKILRSPGKFNQLWYFFLEIRMCSWGILRKALLKFTNSSMFCLSWKIYVCFCTIFGSPGKLDVLL